MAKATTRPPATVPACASEGAACEETARRSRLPIRARVRDGLRGGYEVFAFLVTGLEAILQLLLGRLPNLKPPPPLPPPEPETPAPADRTVAPYPIMD